MAKERALEFKVGLLVLGALVVLGGFVYLLGNFSLGSGYNLYVDYEFSGNIQPGAPVKVSGIKVGRVEDVEFWGGKMDEKLTPPRRVQVRLKVWVQERVKETIRQDAEFFVNTAGVLGEQYLEIAPGSYDKPALPPGSVVRGVDPPRTDLIVARLYEFLDSVSKLLKEEKDRIRELLVNSAGLVKELNGLLSENRQEIGKLIGSANRVADEGAGLMHDVRTGMGDPRVIGRTMTNLENTLASGNRALNDLTPRAGKLLDEGVRVAKLLDEQRVGELMATAGDARKLMTKATGLVGNVDGMVTDLRAGKGTAGALLAREELYADIKEMIRDLKRNPWKFLWKE